MKKKLLVIVVLFVIGCFLFCMKIYVNNKLEEINSNIKEKEQLIMDNDSTINHLQASIEDAAKNNENIEKEYKVWVRQNEKLVDILP